MSEENTKQDEQEKTNQEQETQNDAKIAELEQKNSDLNDKFLRLAAELENVRRRSREEVEKTAKFAVSNFVSDLVLVIENLFLASDNLPQSEVEKSPQIKHFADAVMMTKKELLKILEKNQVSRIFPLNQRFDHNLHEAIAHVDSELEKDVVVQVIQAGYSISNRLIRPALVSVSKGKEIVEDSVSE